jgi:ABC-type multidrug transport system ATPase subunit
MAGPARPRRLGPTVPGRAGRAGHGGGDRGRGAAQALRRVDGRGRRQQIGAQLQKAALPDRLKVWEALDLYASFYDRPVAWPELLRAVRDAGATVVLVTHLMEEAERLCDRVAVIDRGRLVALAPTPRVAEAAGLVGFFPMIFLSGAVVPRESLSEACGASARSCR